MSARPVIIITGASRGIGLGIAQSLLTRANLVLVSRTPSPIQASEHVYHVQTSITNSESARKVVDACLERYKRIDGVIFNAALLEPIARLEHAKIEEWKELFDVNVFGILSWLPEIIPYLRKSKGQIIMISSGAAQHPFPAWSAYCASKAAINMLGMSLALEEPDIATLCVNPGVVDTSMQGIIRQAENQDRMGAEMHARFVEFKEQGTLQTIEDVGNGIADIAMAGGRATRNLSGQVHSWKDYATLI